MYNYYKFSKSIKPSHDFMCMVLDSDENGLNKAQRRLIATYWLAYYRYFKALHSEIVDRAAKSQLVWFLDEIRKIAT